MSGSEEETYSIMFSSLKHPARRKILRMLSERTLTFSQMLDDLAIPSSHLTYHLENLGELVIKSDDGKYKLSSFGKASVSMMKGAEEVPDAQNKRFSALPLRWKTLFVGVTVAVLLLASMSFVQYASITQISSNYLILQQDYNQKKAELDLLQSGSISANKAMTMLKNVVQLNVSSYDAGLIGTPTAEVRNDLGGIVEEITRFSLVNKLTRFEVTFRYRNGDFSQYKLDQIEGAPSYRPIFTSTQSTNSIQMVKEFLQRYQSSTGLPYLQDMISLLASADSNTTEKVFGNTKLLVSNIDSSSTFTLQYTANGVDFLGKTLKITIQNHIITLFDDQWSLYIIGSDQLKVSKEQAVQIAKNEIRSNFTWTVDGVLVSNFTVLENPATAEFFPQTRPVNSVTLYPYWYVTLHLDKTYLGNVNVITVGVWADTGQVANKQALAGTS